MVSAGPDHWHQSESVKLKTRDADPKSVVRLNNEEVLGHKVNM